MHHTLKTFIDLVPHDIKRKEKQIKRKPVKNPKSNLSNEEQETMKHLAKRMTQTNDTADKGGTIVIMDTDNYIKEANRKLSDKNNNKTLQPVPHSTTQ